jgi:hypothetical protein
LTANGIQESRAISAVALSLLTINGERSATLFATMNATEN